MLRGTLQLPSPGKTEFVFQTGTTAWPVAPSDAQKPVQLPGHSALLETLDICGKRGQYKDKDSHVFSAGGPQAADRVGLSKRDLGDVSGRFVQRFRVNEDYGGSLLGNAHKAALWVKPRRSGDDGYSMDARLGMKYYC